jgi:hypothetical protein
VRHQTIEQAALANGVAVEFAPTDMTHEKAAPTPAKAPELVADGSNPDGSLRGAGNKKKGGIKEKLKAAGRKMSAVVATEYPGRKHKIGNMPSSAHHRATSSAGAK